MFVNTQVRILALNGRAKPHFDHSEQLNIGNDKFFDYTFGDLKKALPDSWPKFENGGVVVGAQYVAFDDKDTLASKGVRGSDITTEDYEVILRMLPDQPRPTTSVASATSHSTTKQESDYPKKQQLPTELRIYKSGGTVTVIARSEHTDVYEFSEINFPESEFQSLTLSGFKSTLNAKGWPTFVAGGFHRTKFHGDSEKLSDIGILAFASGTETYHINLVMEASSVPSSEPIVATRTRATSSSYRTTTSTTTESGRKCPKCHTSSTSFKFCPSCGHKLDTPVSHVAPASTASTRSPEPVSSPAYVPEYQRQASREAANQPPPVSPRTSQTANLDSTEFELNVRLFINNTHRILTFNGKTQNFFRSDQVAVLSERFSEYTFGDLKEGLPQTWPFKFQPGGTYKGQPFKDNETLLSRGIRGNRITEFTFDLTFKIAGKKATADSSSSDVSESSIPEKKRLLTEVRLYETPGQVHFIVRSQHPDVYQFTELSIDSVKYSGMSFRDWKDVLEAKHWPAMATGGFFSQKYVNDADKISSILKTTGSTEMYHLTCILK
eukprot:TRINITY_DN5627_c0_g1_i4.p1 TRINITY_DN5627_c0_g1~~TRINITY_DN5627_c0_g1_i4.p1  ORF type:complete len:552 (-),score=89.94 TRINITY_DN5627_c0_g1_i4:68-1723(-)